ncbi:EEV glycoprotein [Orf virus]|uniref:Protein OPG161 n=2 Tax=Orf virus TaxID=10258 RepID=A0A2R4LWH4_ORFV|nr:EEV glycoprotein [Orf virus]AKA27603.1 EEV glycoprotein [Orf virus]AVW89250.1 EEV glycoprotein [Orf virus]
MAHNTFENDSESAANNQYVASVKRQKMIRRYIKMFFRFVTAIAIIVLAILVVILSLSLDECLHREHPHDYSHVQNSTCDGITLGGEKCLRLNLPATWEDANRQCGNLGFYLPSTGLEKKFPWLVTYLDGTWGNTQNSVFGPTGDLQNVIGPKEYKYFCVSD